MKVLYLTFILLFGCTKVHDVIERNGIFYFEDISSEISDVKHVDWEVGKKREITISRGIRLSTSVPVISSSAKSALYSKYGVNAWVFRFNRTKRGRTEQLGHVYYHFDNISRSTKTFTLNVYYHASAVSKHFYYFHCPAFEHRLHLQDVDLESTNVKSESVYLRAMSKIRSKVNRLGFNPLIFSGGRSMLGTYDVEFALYNTKTKQRYSRWHKVEGKVVLTQEVSRSVNSCLGIKEENNPLPQSRPFDIRNIEIK